MLNQNDTCVHLERFHNMAILEDIFPNYDRSYEVLHFDSWSTYEESGWMFILYKDNQHYLLEGGYSVMATDNTDHWLPYAITEDQAIEEMIEWEEMEREDCGV